MSDIDKYTCILAEELSKSAGVANEFETAWLLSDMAQQNASKEAQKVAASGIADMDG